jgi:hypothetical protein
MDIVVWLRSLGLGRYEDACRETVLPNLTAEELKELGVVSLLCRMVSQSISAKAEAS